MPKLTPPADDWTFRTILDAIAVFDEPARCEFCNRRIRWVHVLEHDQWPHAMNAGCCCALHRCSDYDAEGAEREIKSRAAKLMRFIDASKWQPSRNDPANRWRWATLGKRKRVRVTVYLKEGRYGVFVEGAPHWDRYGTQEEAKEIAFELVELLKNQGQ